jgi:fructose-bisphosphate aldolase class II
MPIADPAQFAEMLDTAKHKGFAYPSVNVTSSETLNAALRGFSEADSDGIVQISTGGAAYLSGSVNDKVTGAIALSELAHVLAEHYPSRIGLHTDHCPPAFLDSYLRPLLDRSAAHLASSGRPLFISHMWDGSTLPLDQNLDIAGELLGLCQSARAVLEIEIGVVGGEEDGIAGATGTSLYSTPADALAVAEHLGLGERGRYILAATFGNVHGVYQPDHVHLRPDILKSIQTAVGERYGRTCPFDLVFHGGSGSAPADVRETIGYGVVKFNVDTDNQYAYTRAVAGHVFTHYDQVLKVDGGLGAKAAYDPRSYGTAAEKAMAAHVSHVCAELGSAGQRID